MFDVSGCIMAHEGGLYVLTENDSKGDTWVIWREYNEGIRFSWRLIDVYRWYIVYNKV